jgi:hypothetical protein
VRHWFGLDPPRHWIRTETFSHAPSIPLGQHTKKSRWPLVTAHECVLQRGRQAGNPPPWVVARRTSSTKYGVINISFIARHGLQDETSPCFTCLQDEDNVDHILAHCVYAREVWHTCFNLLRVNIQCPTPEQTLRHGGSTKDSGCMAGQKEALTHSSSEQHGPSGSNATPGSSTISPNR